MDLPYFKYHPDPVRNRVIVQGDTTCPSCHLNRGYKYEGPYYCLLDVENICPWCIKDGKAAAKFSLQFVDEYSLTDIPDDEKLEELLCRTPGYFSAQGEEWPTHCGDFCAVVGRPEWAHIEALREELRPDLEKMQAKLEVSDKEFYEDLQRKYSPLWVYLFKCVSCGKHRIVGAYE
jgi:hypothetical protein